jgi:hypothetical protein
MKLIDLVEIQTIMNPILKKSIDRDKFLLFGREYLGDYSKTHSDLKTRSAKPDSGIVIRI